MIDYSHQLLSVTTLAINIPFSYHKREFVEASKFKSKLLSVNIIPHNISKANRWSLTKSKRLFKGCLFAEQLL